MGRRQYAVEVELLAEHRLHARQHDREVLGASARHDGVGGDLLDGGLPVHRRDRAEAGVELPVRVRQGLVDPLPGRLDDREAVG